MLKNSFQCILIKLLLIFLNRKFLKIIGGELLLKKIFALLLSFTLIFSVGCGQSDKTIKFGAAQVGGVYLSFANAYSQFVADSDEDIELNVKATAGSAANLRLISDNYIQLAIAQADLTNDAYYGKNSFVNNKLQGYSAIANLYTEACQLIVKADSDIYTVDDLLHKTVSLGENESGTERNAKQILQIYGLSDDLYKYKNLNYTDAANALSDGSIDAMFCTSGVQTTVIEELAKTTDIRIISMDEEHIQKLMSAYSYYSEYTIPAGMYTGLEEDVTTIGVKCLLLANDSLDSKTVEKLTQLLFDNEQNIQYSLPLDFSLDTKSATENISIPFHKGAAAYYETQGITVEQ